MCIRDSPGGSLQGAVGIEEYIYRAEWTHQTIHEPVFDNRWRAADGRVARSDVLTETTFRRNVKVITQRQPHISQVAPLFDQLPGCRPQLR